MQAATATAPRYFVWVVSFALAGFAAGFFGPIAFNPEANQGPLLGIFITGPGGAVLGAVLGLIAKLMPSHAARTLRWSLAIFVGAVLVYCFPGPKTQGDVYRLQVLNCSPPQQLLPDAFAYWDERIAAVTWHAPRVGWKQQATASARAAPGVVIRAKVLTRTQVVQHRKPWSFGRLGTRAAPADEAPRQFYAEFAGDDCEAYSEPGRAFFASAGQGSQEWPPTELPNLLDLRELQDVPARYARLSL